MNARRTLAILLRHIYLLQGSPARVLPLFAWVAIDIVLWGFITKYLNSVSQSGFNFVPTLLGAVLLWDFYSRVMQGVTMAFFEDVWSRNFLNIFSTPLSIAEYLGGLVLSSTMTSMVGLIAMLLLASAVFGLSFFGFGLTLVPFIFVLFVFGIAIGIVGSAIVLRLGPAAEWFIWPIPALISPFAGVFYPLSTLPEWMQTVARGIPASYVFESLRAIIGGSSGIGAGHMPLGQSLLWGASLAALYVAGASWLFAATHRRALRTGLIARYSAETVN